MTSCTIIGLIISCTITDPRPTPQSAVEKMVTPYVYAPTLSDEVVEISKESIPSPRPAFDKYWPFQYPPSALATPYQPWSVTTYIGRSHYRSAPRSSKRR